MAEKWQEVGRNELGKVCNIKGGAKKQRVLTIYEGVKIIGNNKKFSIERLNNSTVIDDICDSYYESYYGNIFNNLLQGKSISSYNINANYDQELLQENLYQLINKICFKLAKSIWYRIRSIFNIKQNQAPFVFFNKQKQWFELSEGTNEEDLQLIVKDDKLLYINDFGDNDVIINPVFLQKQYRTELQTGEEDYIHHLLAMKLENYLIEKVQLNIS